VLTAKRVVTSAFPNVSSVQQINLFYSRLNGLIWSGNYLYDNIFVVKFSVMCHFYAQETLPVPAVMVVTLYPPDAAAVEPVRPTPIVIV
jgi:hypothetical protein